MKKYSKRYSLLIQKVQKGKLYSKEEAVSLLKELHTAKFDETVELSVKLGVNPKKIQQPIRGSVVLPHGTGKKVKILVFAQGENVEKAKKAGADYVGGQELVDKIKEGWLDFDVIISTPDMMKIVTPLGKILGPKGLMPTPKTGTVTSDVEKIINELKKGRIDFKMDKDGNIHLPVGKISFGNTELEENITAGIEAISNAKSSISKSIPIKSINLSLTMSPSVPLDVGKIIQQFKI